MCACRFARRICRSLFPIWRNVIGPGFDRTVGLLLAELFQFATLNLSSWPLLDRHRGSPQLGHTNFAVAVEPDEVNLHLRALAQEFEPFGWSFRLSQPLDHTREHGGQGAYLLPLP